MPVRRQTDRQTAYAGTALLLQGERLLANYNAGIVELFVPHLPPRGPGATWNALDFGAGIGTLSHIFHARTGVQPEGMEIDTAQRQLYTERGFVAHASLDGISALYDVIFTSNVLEHIEDDVGTLALLQRRLKPGGVLLVYVPAFRSIWTALDERVGHYRRYTLGELEHKLSAASLKVTHSRYCDSIGYGLALAFKYVGSTQGEPSAWALRLFDRWLLPLSRRLDRLTHRRFGKNVFAVAIKPLVAPGSHASR